MNAKFTRTVLVGMILSLLLLTQSAFADNVYATVRGHVADSTGAVLPGVQVTATNTQTGVSTSTTSQEDGRYEFLQLAVGAAALPSIRRSAWAQKQIGRASCRERV